VRVGALRCASLVPLVDLRNSTVARTDAAGRFDFGRKLKHGFYEIYARKDKDGYPDPTSKFYQPPNFRVQNVQLYGDHPAERVTVQLREKAAILAGRVYDAATGLPLKAEVGFINLRTETGEFGMRKGAFQRVIWTSPIESGRRIPDRVIRWTR
jgi:hypothetical protein